MDGRRDEPLRDEAARRREWRGNEGETAPPRAEGHTLPASEDDDERLAPEGRANGDGGPPMTAPPD